MDERERAIARVVRAVTDEGFNPGYHRAVIRHLNETWPLMHAAIMDLVRIERTRTGENPHGPPYR